MLSTINRATLWWKFLKVMQFFLPFLISPRSNPALDPDLQAQDRGSDQAIWKGSDRIWIQNARILCSWKRAFILCSSYSSWHSAFCTKLIVVSLRTWENIVTEYWNQFTSSIRIRTTQIWILFFRNRLRIVQAALRSSLLKYNRPWLVGTDKIKPLTIYSQLKLTLTAVNTLFHFKSIGDSKNLETMLPRPLLRPISEHFFKIFEIYPMRQSLKLPVLPR